MDMASKIVAQMLQTLAVSSRTFLSIHTESCTAKCSLVEYLLISAIDASSGLGLLDVGDVANI
jgi:hypothetical protein